MGMEASLQTAEAERERVRKAEQIAQLEHQLRALRGEPGIDQQMGELL